MFKLDWGHSDIQTTLTIYTQVTNATKKQPICLKTMWIFKYGSRHYNFKQKTALSKMWEKAVSQ